MTYKSTFRDRLHEWLLRVNRLYHKRFYTIDSNPDGIDIFEEDWDSLVLLDACRYDALADQDELPGNLESRISRGSQTYEFLRANFTDRDLRDTVYVTATPQYHRFEDELNTTFHDVINIWSDDSNVWYDKGRQVVRPETTTEHALQAAERYPNKRLLVHYIQPHTPFLDRPTEELRTDKNIYRQFISGELPVDASTLREAYRRNVDITIPHVADLVKGLDGRTVVSADHGELLGERLFPVPVSGWGHPHGTYVDELVRVPWLVHEQGERRDVTAESSKNSVEEVEKDVVKERLQSLGYTN
ncbi:alkaline phosphatase family protein [Haloarcula sp. H-GB5]